MHYFLRRPLGHGLRTAWDSGGEPTALDAAAHDLADAFGLFFAHLLHALVAEIVGQPAGLSDERRAGQVAGRLRPTRLGTFADDLGTFLVRDHVRLLATFKTGPVVKGPPTRV